MVAQLRAAVAADVQPVLYVNGKLHKLPGDRAEQTLLSYLREKGLTGTKLGCGEGGCGACTVMVSSWEGDKVLHRSVNACLCPLYAVEGMHVVTVEGIGNVRQGLHPVQERLALAHGSQCGFCTPGFVMSMYALLRSKPTPPSEAEIEETLAGNLCRCTGYRPILDAFKVFAKSEPAAYTEEAIAASQDLPAKGAALSNGHAARDGKPHANGGAGADGDANGHANGHANGNGCESNGECTHRDAVNGVNGAMGAAGISKNGANAAFITDPKAGVLAPATGGAKAVCPSTGQPCNCGAVSIKGPAPGAEAPNTQEVITSSGDKLTACGPGRYTRPSAEPIFPPALRKRQLPELPLTLCTLLALKRTYPGAKLVVGNTEVGIEMKFKSALYPVLIGVTHVPELTTIQVCEDGLLVGASVTLSALEGALHALCAQRAAHETHTFVALLEQLKYFAGRQIRNTASVGGNVVTGSPISDVNPIYMAAGVTFTVVGEGTGERQVLASEFFLGYRRVDLAPHEILKTVHIPFTRRLEYVREFKQAHRRDDDIAIVNAAMRARLVEGAQKGEWEVAEAHLAFGGVAPKTIMAPRAAAALTGRPLSASTLEAALAALAQDVNITPNAPGGMVEFRRSLAASFLFQFFVHLGLRLEADVPGFASEPLVPPRHASAALRYERKAAQGLQYYTKAANGAVVGQPQRHMAADLQVSGEALYVDDVKLPADALHAALVVSARPHAKILSIDTAPALEVPGVEGIFTADDVPGHNDLGAVVHDEELFATKEVVCVGQPIGIVVAASEVAARRGAAAVKVVYEDLPVVMSIEEAIAAGSFFEREVHSVVDGDVEGAWAGCDHVLEGVARVGGQEHFYLEPNATVVLPGEDDEICILSSTQAPNHNQAHVAHTLGIAAHKVVCRTKRLGGGFGGKETRAVPLSCLAAVPAWHTRRAVRLVYDRDEDMQISGHRHAFMGKWKVGCTREGQLLAADIQLFSNGGCSLDLSESVMDRALLHADCCYKVPNIRVVGRLCRTNQASNTAFRGFGGPQGMMVAEMWMDAVARAVGKPPEAVRELNMYHEGQLTHFGQRLEGCQIRACWEVAKSKASWAQRLAGVAQFNAANRFRKRGLALIPTKFGISFTAKFLNQAGALVHIYTDGTVLVTHGGVEMGQGLHTKVAQVAAQALGVPLGAVFIAETATDKVPNASPTAASASSDLYGGAVTDACSQLKNRLAPFREKLPGATFREVVNAAYLDRVDLSAHGFYITPDVTGWGGKMPFNYFCYGAAATEVELNTLTGDFHVLRTDLCMDVGQSLNPAIDIGQVEGGFVQGLGWACIEELVWGDTAHSWVPPGMLFTRGPGTYKIPSANDIPLDLRVTLLRDAPCERTPLAHSSKAVGEPPLFLGASAFFALKEACYAARAEAVTSISSDGAPSADASSGPFFQLDSPCTPERLRMACSDFLTARFASPDYLPKISC